MTPNTSQRQGQSKAGITALSFCILAVACLPVAWFFGALAEPSDDPPPHWRLALIAWTVTLYAGLFSIGFGLYGSFQRKRKRRIAAVALAASLILVLALAWLNLQHLQDEAASEVRSPPELQPRPLQ